MTPLGPIVAKLVNEIADLKEKKKESNKGFNEVIKDLQAKAEHYSQAIARGVSTLEDLEKEQRED